MTDGKLVRDLVPRIIRGPGRDVDAQYLTGTDLVSTLVAKILEAREVQRALVIEGHRRGMNDLVWSKSGRRITRKTAG